MDPLALFQSERDLARQADDPMAHICTVANVDEQGAPQARTLVLRDLEGQLAIFVNASSPKWQHLQDTFVVHTYWPSKQIQYRMKVSASPVENQLVHDSWHMRPDAPKRMDWFYEHVAAQSSTIASRQLLLDDAMAMKLPEPLVAPVNAKGLFLEPSEIERLDLTQPEGIHDRTRFQMNGGKWVRQVLVP